MGKALDHKRRILAAQAAKKAADSDDMNMEGQPIHNAMALQLQAHMHELGGIKSTQAKVLRKADFLPTYDPYIEGVLSADSGAQDDVFMNILVWCIDCGRYPQAIEMAAYAMRHDVALPARFERDLATLLVEEITEHAEENEGPSLDTLFELEGMTADADMHDQVRAKLYKAIGFKHEAAGQLEAAIKAYETAIEFNDRVGVKNTVKKLTKAIADQKTKDN